MAATGDWSPAAEEARMILQAALPLQKLATEHAQLEGAARAGGQLATE